MAKKMLTESNNGVSFNNEVEKLSVSHGSFRFFERVLLNPLLSKQIVLKSELNNLLRQQLCYPTALTITLVGIFMNSDILRIVLIPIGIIIILCTYYFSKRERSALLDLKRLLRDYGKMS